MQKICLIIPYFGALPEFFHYFLLTAKRNVEIDFLIFTDQEISFEAKNIIIRKMSFDALRQMIQSKFSFPIALSKPYKLCDYKVAYGYIFEEYCKEYSYWGFCDTDILLGDVYAYLSEKNFFQEGYERFGLLGHLQIYKNTPRMKMLFQAGDERRYRLYYKTVFQTPYNFNFDEERGMDILCQQNQVKQLQTQDFDDIDITSFAFKNYGESQKRRYYIWTDTHGLVRADKDGKKPVLYAHFQKRVMQCPDTWNERISAFYAIPNKIVHDFIEGGGGTQKSSLLGVLCI